MPKLTDRRVRTLKQPGMHGDGDGLYVRVGPTGGKSWILRTVVHGRRKELGLGSASLVGLAEARELARTYRKIARSGGDPDSVRKMERFTFYEAAKRVHAELLPTWRNKKHADTWLATIELYVNPFFGERPIASVGTSDVLKALTPIWIEKHETAKRLLQRISTIFDWAKGAGHYPDENPVNGVRKALPRVKRTAPHLAAMPWQEVPAFVAELGSRKSVSARTLEFVVLTAVRSGEARGARWSEISGSVWTIPAERMKRGVEHRVPLSSAALEVLDRVRGLDEELIFPSVQATADGKAKVQSVMVFKSLFRRMQREGFTTHGFRSSFRDWCSESVRADREVAEAALSHASGDTVERAYARSDLFERRRELMELWARFVGGQKGTVVAMVRV